MALKIALLGDVCLTGKFDLLGNPDAYKQFEAIKAVLASYDLVLANLESPFTELGSSWVCKAIHIKSAPVNAKLLQYLGVSAVSLANNHIFDYGRDGYRTTLAALDQAGIGYFGTEGRQLALEKNRERLLLGGFCCLTAHPSAAGAKGVTLLNHSNLKQFLRQAEEQGFFPIASVHWGDENIHYPNEDHVRFARLMAGEHDFLLHGHHPHVIQGLEVAGNSLIAYSLGNFCTDVHISRSVRHMRVMQSAANRLSYILGVTLENGKILDREIIPIADMENGILVQGEAARASIAAYSSALSDSGAPYRRPEQVSLRTQTVERNAPARFSLTWFLLRLNYHFVGAFVKGLCNRAKYRRYFSEVRSRAAEKGI